MFSLFAATIFDELKDIRQLSDKLVKGDKIQIAHNIIYSKYGTQIDDTIFTYLSKNFVTYSSPLFTMLINEQLIKLMTTDKTYNILRGDNYEDKIAKYKFTNCFYKTKIEQLTFEYNFYILRDSTKNYSLKCSNDIIILQTPTYSYMITENKNTSIRSFYPISELDYYINALIYHNTKLVKITARQTLTNNSYVKMELVPNVNIRSINFEYYVNRQEIAAITLIFKKLNNQLEITILIIESNLDKNHLQSNVYDDPTFTIEQDINDYFIEELSKSVIVAEDYLKQFDNLQGLFQLFEQFYNKPSIIEEEPLN